MTVLIDSASEDTESEWLEATGPILVAVLGVPEAGYVEVFVDLGIGAVLVEVFLEEGVRLINICSGALFAVVARGVRVTDAVTVEYLSVSGGEAAATVYIVTDLGGIIYNDAGSALEEE